MEGKADNSFYCCEVVFFLPLKPSPAGPQPPFVSLSTLSLSHSWQSGGFLCCSDPPCYLSTLRQAGLSCLCPHKCQGTVPGLGFFLLTSGKSFPGVTYSSFLVPITPLSRMGTFLWVPCTMCLQGTELPDLASLISLCPAILTPSAIARQDLQEQPLAPCCRSWLIPEVAVQSWMLPHQLSPEL